ncbi:hypothetical protein D3C71_1057970 [compost metagenome]
MRLGSNAITLTPFDNPFERFVQQLPGHYRQHDLAQHWYEHRHHVQAQHADFQQVIELCRPSLRIDLSGRDGMAARIGDDLGAVLLVEISPQIGVGGPDSGYVFTRRTHWVEVRIFHRFALAPGFRGQLLDTDERGDRRNVLGDLDPDGLHRIARSVRRLAGELAEVVRAVGVSHELTEKTLVCGRPAIACRP